MKIGQFKKNGEKKLIVIDNNNVYENSFEQNPNTNELIKSIKFENLSKLIKELIKSNKLIKISENEDFLYKNNYLMLKPVEPSEAWAAGVTYKRQYS